MPRTHNALNRSILGRAVTAALGVKQPEQGLERFSETVQPTIDMWGRPEWDFLRNEVRAADGATIAGGAATTLASWAIMSPAAGSKQLLIVIEELVVQVAVAATIRVGLDTEAAIAAQIATVRTGTLIDTRWVRPGIASNPAARILSGTTAISLGSQIYNIGIPTTPTLVETARGVVLHPGFGLIVQNGDDTAILNVACKWRERQALSGELP